MFRKKLFPPGTFIPTQARVAAILHLSIAFTLVAWYGSLPFMGELFSTKSKMLVYQHLIKNDLFQELTEKEQILQDYDRLQKRLETPFPAKLGHAFETLWQLPLLKKGWLFFSILIPILLLKKVEGATALVWVLPLLTLAYAIENRLQGHPPLLSADQRLFPTEEEILGRPAANLAELKQAWERYLIENWASTPQRADFAFTRARIEALKEKPPTGEKQQSLALLGVYLFWNVSFAFIVLNTPQLRQNS